MLAPLSHMSYMLKHVGLASTCYSFSFVLSFSVLQQFLWLLTLAASTNQSIFSPGLCIRSHNSTTLVTTLIQHLTGRYKRLKIVRNALDSEWLTMC